MPVELGPDWIDISAVTWEEALAYGEVVERQGNEFSVEPVHEQGATPLRGGQPYPDQFQVNYRWRKQVGVYTLSLTLSFDIEPPNSSAGLGINIKRSNPITRPGYATSAAHYIPHHRRKKLEKSRWFTFYDKLLQNRMRYEEIKKLCGKFLPLFSAAYLKIYECIGQERREHWELTSAPEEDYMENVDQEIMHRLTEAKSKDPLTGFHLEEPIFRFDQPVDFTIDLESPQRAAFEIQIGSLRIYNFAFVLIVPTGTAKPELEKIRAILAFQFKWAKQKRSSVYMRGGLAHLLEHNWQFLQSWDEKIAAGSMQHGFLYFQLENSNRYLERTAWQEIDLAVRREIVALLQKCFNENYAAISAQAQEEQIPGFYKTQHWGLTNAPEEDYLEARLWLYVGKVLTEAYQDRLTGMPPPDLT